MSAAKRYPFEITRRARERRMANWLNSRTAVIKSFMKYRRAIGRDEGVDPPQLDVREFCCQDEKGAKEGEHDARASRFCAGPGGKVARVGG